jgi:hypothetical protein
MSEINEDEQVNLYKINLGGFPPIIKLNNIVKKKREFNKNINQFNKNLLDNMNILNIKNILSKK